MKAPSRVTLLRAYEWILRVEINRAAREAREASRLRRCGAKRKRDGNLCSAKPLANGRCKFHGGLSKGPKTPEGRIRALANLKQNRAGALTLDLRTPRRARAIGAGAGEASEAINRFLAETNDAPRPFTGTADPDKKTSPPSGAGTKPWT